MLCGVCLRHHAGFERVSTHYHRQSKAIEINRKQSKQTLTELTASKAAFTPTVSSMLPLPACPQHALVAHIHLCTPVYTGRRVDILHSRRSYTRIFIQKVRLFTPSRRVDHTGSWRPCIHTQQIMLHVFIYGGIEFRQHNIYIDALAYILYMV